jgi:ATPase complex subunit ATP10
VFLGRGRGVVASSQLWGVSHLELDNARQEVFTRRLNIFTVFNKEARAKEKARLQDELNRGYFDDFREMKRTGGKVAPASASLSPIAGSPRFSPLEVCIPKGATLTLPLDDALGPTLVCVAFRASAQPMVLSWSAPFAQKFAGSTLIKVFEVSVIESSLLSIWPIKPLLLHTMRGSQQTHDANALERHVVYAFGDAYEFRKVLGVPNLLSGYVFLLDRKGRVRWRASGMATEQELDSMAMCTSRLLQEEKSLKPT